MADPGDRDGASRRSGADTQVITPPAQAQTKKPHSTPYYLPATAATRGATLIIVNHEDAQGERRLLNTFYVTPRM